MKRRGIRDRLADIRKQTLAAPLFFPAVLAVDVSLWSGTTCGLPSGIDPLTQRYRSNSEG